MEEMPLLNEWSVNNKDVQVLGISIDRDTLAYKNTVAQFSNMIHSCDFKGWDTEAALKYYIMATPSFILLDEKKRILKKASSFKQISENFKLNE